MVVNEPDFMVAVNDLIMEITNIDQVRLFRGHQSREVLPADNDFIIYTPLFRGRRGTNINTFDAGQVEATADGDYADKVLVTCDIQIDCYGDNADKYAQGLETFCKSILCNSWLKTNGYGISVLYTNSPQDFTRVDDTAQYITRWSITLTVCFTYEVTNEVPWFDSVQLKGTTIDPETGKLTPASDAGVVDVDVFFKP